MASALEILRSAQRPAIFAGGGVPYSGAADQLMAFAERAGIPVLTNNKSRGVVPSRHPLNAKGFGSLGGAAARGAGEADAILLLGARQGLYTGGARKSVIPAGAKLIQVDLCAEEIGRLRDVDVGIVADCKSFLDALILECADISWPDRSEWISAVKGPPLDEPADPQLLTPEVLAGMVARAIPEGAITVVDGGETPSWLDGIAESVEPGRWLGHGYLGVMGEGMPLAIGAQVGNPDRHVICFTGDGSIGFNFAEFDTMVRHDLPIIVVVNNDQQWAMSAHGQDLLYGSGHRIVSELAPTRYDLAAEGFGAHAEHVTDVEGFAPAFERALASGRPACINVMTSALMHMITRRMIGLAATGLESPEGLARVPYADILEI